MIQSDLKDRLNKVLDDKIISSTVAPGGCIAKSYTLDLASGKKLFLKTFDSHSSSIFRAEAVGLQELGQAGEIKVPEVIYVDDDLLLLEFIESGSTFGAFFSDFGRGLAKLHKHSSKQFGFIQDNFIGSTRQKNEYSDSWSHFYFHNRLLFQTKLAEERGLATRELLDGISRLEGKIDKILEGSSELPALLHGDLWGGNFLITETCEPCLIDPAVYYGHREADLAMTKLFGGFAPDFYQGYNSEYPLAEGYEYREGIYKLYHLLNHLNIFGSSYYSQCIEIIRFYL